jgi:hypothetical protein
MLFCTEIKRAFPLERVFALYEGQLGQNSAQNMQLLLAF